MTTTIFGHHDADGIISSYFARYGIPDSQIKIVDKFGDTSEWTKGDYMVDMRPDNPDIEGTVIDHHFPHPDKRKYTLIPDIKEDVWINCNAIVPASLLTWRHFKDSIPKDQWWKLMIGLVGDGQPELMPVEIFDICPELMQTVKTSSYESYGKLNINFMPVYKLLSSGINAFMRKGEWQSALNLIEYADTPLDIHTSIDVAAAKSDVYSEYKTALKDSQMFSFGNLTIVVYESRYRMSGYIGSSVSSALKEQTVMAINSKNGSLSLRGKLAPYYKQRLSSLDYINIDGHSEFMGGKLSKNYLTFINDLNRIL